jgi:hypothetical protein
VSWERGDHVVPGDLVWLSLKMSYGVTLTKRPGVLNNLANTTVGEAEPGTVMLVLATANVDRLIGDEAMVLTDTGCFGWIEADNLRVVL